MRVALAGETDVEGFRRAARSLLARGVSPDCVHWGADLFGEPCEFTAAEAPAPRVPAFFAQLCDAVLLHRDPQRFALLYRLLWRLVHEPMLRHDPLDADILKLRAMSRQVGHSIHKMRAFVRFRMVNDAGPDPLHVAWFEPDHRVTEANAPWFRRRFANMRWAIMTPDACVHWDRERLRVEPGAERADAPSADAGEALWLTYYRSIFNPARLKLDMMRKEMPQRYWRNLPEAALVGELSAAAGERTSRMVEQPAEAPRRRIVPIAPVSMVEAEGLEDLATLHARIEACRECPGAAAATQAVNGRGAQQAELMLVGEQPGDQEDLRGQPFIGPAGELLRQSLAASGIPESGLYLTNAVRHFHFEPRGRRRIHKTPGQREVAACSHWLEQEIALVQPRALVALGATAARALLGRPVAVLKERGTWHKRADGLQVLVTLHPSALLRLPEAERASRLTEFRADLTHAYISSRDFARPSSPASPRGP